MPIDEASASNDRHPYNTNITTTPHAWREDSASSLCKLLMIILQCFLISTLWDLRIPYVLDTGKETEYKAANLWKIIEKLGSLVIPYFRHGWGNVEILDHEMPNFRLF